MLEIETMPKRGKWIGYVQWQGGLKRAGRASTFEAALELARELASRLDIVGHISVGASYGKIEIDPAEQQGLSKVLHGLGGDNKTLNEINVQLGRIRARINRARRKKND